MLYPSASFSSWPAPVARYPVAQEILETAQVVGQAPGQPVTEFAGDRGVAGPCWPSRQPPGQPGALIGSPSRIHRDPPSGQPAEIVQARDGLVDRAVVLMPLVGVNRGRIDSEVVKHGVQYLTRPVAEHLARDHEDLTAIEVIEERRELEPVPAWPEVTVVQQRHLRAAPLPAG